MSSVSAVPLSSPPPWPSPSDGGGSAGAASRADDDKPSVASRLVRYVLPGALAGAALSIATFGIGGLVLTLASVGGLPQRVRSYALGELSLKDDWAGLSTFDKITAVAGAILLTVCLLAGASTYLSFQAAALPETLVVLALLTIPGVIGGVFFSANLCDPPLIDLSDYEIRQY